MKEHQFKNKKNKKTNFAEFFTLAPKTNSTFQPSHVEWYFKIL